MIQVNAITQKGGAVELNKKHGVWASYAVATAGDLPPAECLHAAVKLPDNRIVKLFVNRENGLVVVDVANPKGTSGVEILRQKV